MTRRAVFAATLSLFLVAACTAHAAPAITTESLLGEMIDLKGMAEFPSPAYTTKQFSSYDRAAKSPSQNWFANGDAGQYLRVEDRDGRKEYVMMDAQGPGAIVRIWSANPDGTLRIYIDGNEVPALEAKMSQLLGGQFPGLPRPIAGEYSKGWNLYFPIPYAKSCKVTSDAGKFYYHVNYRTYEPGTEVQSFKIDQIQALQSRIRTVMDAMSNPRAIEETVRDSAEAYQVELQPGESSDAQFSGPRALLGSTVKVTAANVEEALRGVIVRMTFDGERCVEAPLGDLFGSAPGISPYQTLVSGMEKDGLMWQHWFMPFKETCEITLLNTTKSAVSLSGHIAMADYQWTDRSMHFHAKWRVQWDVPTRPMIDWNYLTARGQGVFAGVSFSIDNPVKDWWGEGDEKIYVDGETFPSHFGTGTEDYYGYAWCWPALFTHAYHSQSRCDGPGNYGRTSVNRFHIADRIPYQKDFKFDMELWHWNQNCKVNMAVVAYWYARPGGTDAFKPIQAEDAVVRPMPEYVVPRVKGALEGEEMKVVRVSGVADRQDWGDESAGGHIWWHEGFKPGDTLELAFNAPKAGKYQVAAKFLKARDYGIHQLSINGQKVGEPMDFFNAPNVVPTKEIPLGVFDLKEGENRLSVQCVGANPRADGFKYMFGLDYIILKPQ